MKATHKLIQNAKDRAKLRSSDKLWKTLREINRTTAERITGRI